MWKITIKEISMNGIDIGVRIIIGILLLVSGMIDIKTKCVSVKLVIMCLIPIIIALPFREEITLIEGLLGMLIGILILGIGKFTRGQIGSGDGLVLIVTGIALGGYNNLRMLMYGLFLVSMVSILLLITKKIKFKSTLPFLPFLCMGYVLVLIDTWR